MSTDGRTDGTWSSGEAYERYVGRWSRWVARDFIRWLALPENSQWLDVGCGTGALSQTILEMADPQQVTGVDRSEEFVSTARRKLTHTNVEFRVGDAQSLPVDSDVYDVAVSGLVLNFIPKPGQMISEMKRAVRAGGTVALYVWDYADGMQFMRHFWDVAAVFDPATSDLDEGRRFSVCSPDSLAGLFQAAGFQDSGIETRPIDISTHFKDFDDYWMPFLGGQGPAPTYVMSLSEERRSQLRDMIYQNLPFASDGSIPLTARVWAIKAVK